MATITSIAGTPLPTTLINGIIDGCLSLARHVAALLLRPTLIENYAATQRAHRAIICRTDLSDVRGVVGHQTYQRAVCQQSEAVRGDCGEVALASEGVRDAGAGGADVLAADIAAAGGKFVSLVA